MTAAVAVRDTMSSPRATAIAVAKAFPIIIMEAVMNASMGIGSFRQPAASAARKATRMFMRENATSAITAACTTVIPVPVVRRTLPIIIMESVMHASMGIRS